MILKSLKLKNVKCYDEAEVSFIQGKNVIVGRNGSGKSTLLQSILYSMYALYPQGTNDQLVRTGATSAEFELELEHNGTDYLVERKLRTSGSPEAYLTEKESEIELAETQTGVTDELSGLVNTKKEVFRDVILVRQGEIAKIIDMTPSDRKNLFDRLLGLHDYEAAYRNCAGIKRILEGKAQESERLMAAYKESAGKLDGRKENLSKLNQALKTDKSKQKKLEIDFSGIEKDWERLEGLSTEIGKIETSIKTREESLEKSKKSAEKLQGVVLDQCKSLKITISKTLTNASLKKITEKVEKEGELLTTTIEQAGNVKSKLDKLLEQQTSLETQIEIADKDLTKNNNKATRDGGDDWKSKVELDLKELEMNLENKEKEVGTAQTEYRRLAKETAQQESDTKRLEKELKDLTKLVGKICPKCKQVVTDEHAEELSKSVRKEIKESKEHLITLQGQEGTSKQLLETLQAQEREIDELVGLVKRLEIYQETERGLVERREGLVKESESVENKIESLFSEIFLLKELSLSKSKIMSLPLEFKIDELGTQLVSLRQRTKSLGSLANEANNLAALFTLNKEQEDLIETDRDKLVIIEQEYDSAMHKKLTGKRNDLNKQISALEERLRILKDEQIPEAEEQLGESKTAAENMASLETQQIGATKALAVLEKVREFYREIQRPLRRRDLQRASREASQIFRTLIGSNEFERIRITEDHDLQISRLGELEPMSMLSGGEQVLASLSVRLGFARALANSDLLILDEPTAFLDDQRRAELVETLHRVSPARQMLIVTHDDEFQRIAQRVIHVEKDESTLRSYVSWDE